VPADPIDLLRVAVAGDAGLPAEFDESRPLAAAVAFGRLLRRAELDVSVDSVAAFAEALGVVGLDRRNPAYWSGRATLVRRPEDLDAYDRAFAAFWSEVAPPGPGAPARAEVALALDDDDEAPDVDGGDGGDDDSDPALTMAVRFSAAEALRDKDFAACTLDERDELHRAMARLRVGGATRRSLRRVAARRPEGRPDLRATVRAALRTEGEAVQPRWRVPADKPRRLVLLVDVSASMEPYARALIRFAHAAVVGRRRVEAFTLGTRLTRVTRQLGWRDPDGAIAAAADSVPDWSGGTRLGDGLRRFNDRWGAPGMARGAVVVLLSDGWDRGDPAVLAEQMARLHRVAHRVVWVNPLKAAPGYVPLAQGMAAALPYVDAFVEGHSLASIEHVAEVIAA